MVTVAPPIGGRSRWNDVSANNAVPPPSQHRRSCTRVRKAAWRKRMRVVALVVLGFLVSTLSAHAQNLLAEGGFEQYATPSLGTPGWVSDRTTPAKSESNQPHSGAQNGACWSINGTDCGMYQDVTAQVGGTYTYTVWAAADVAGGLVGANVNGTGVASANVV